MTVAIYKGLSWWPFSCGVEQINLGSFAKRIRKKKVREGEAEERREPKTARQGNRA